jgi:hypothetical protein
VQEALRGHWNLGIGTDQVSSQPKAVGTTAKPTKENLEAVSFGMIGQNVTKDHAEAGQPGDT